ncbi:MAG: DUF2442 domain-containing protein [Magnetococcales bacterium]|nr:DUF2442 domain-containing protein [Magnetococcales bacterium]
MFQAIRGEFREFRGHNTKLLGIPGTQYQITSGVADLAKLVHSTPNAAPLRNLEEFRRVFLDEWPTLAWPCGFDLAPEYAYRLVTGKTLVWQSPPIAKSA